MLLQEFFQYKNKIMELFCNNQELVELVSGNPDTDGLTLPYTRIFPFEFVPETIDDGDTFICYDVDIPEIDNEVIYSPVIWVWIFTHKSRLRLPKGGVRTDKIAEVVDHMLNGNRELGLGELDLKMVGRFVPQKDFQGRVLAYQAHDTNRWGVHRNPPARRR